MSILESSSRRLRSYIVGLPFSGMIGAGLFFALSMAPSLIPREPEIQGMLSGFTAAVGFWFGLAVGWLWTFFELPVLTGRVGKAVRFTASAFTIFVIGYSLWRGEVWQNSLREFLGLGPLEAT